MFWQCFRPWASDIYWAADATTQRLAHPRAGKTYILLLALLLLLCYFHLHRFIYLSIEYNSAMSFMQTVMLLQYSVIYTLDTNNYWLLPTLFLIWFLNKAHHTHPGSLWQLITRTLQPSKNNQLPVPSRYKHVVRLRVPVVYVTYPLFLLIFLYTLSSFKVGDLRTGKLSRTLSWTDWAL